MNQVLFFLSFIEMLVNYYYLLVLFFMWNKLLLSTPPPLCSILDEFVRPFSDPWLTFPAEKSTEKFLADIMLVKQMLLPIYVHASHLHFFLYLFMIQNFPWPMTRIHIMKFHYLFLIKF